MKKKKKLLVHTSVIDAVAWEGAAGVFGAHPVDRIRDLFTKQGWNVSFGTGAATENGDGTPAYDCVLMTKSSKTWFEEHAKKEGWEKFLPIICDNDTEVRHRMEAFKREEEKTSNLCDELEEVPDLYKG